MEDFFDRFDKYMKYKGLNDNQVTVMAGLSIGSLGKQRKGSRGLSVDSIAKLLRTFIDLNVEWLLTGQGSMLRTGLPGGPVEGCLPGEAGVSPPVCERCRDKDAVIAAQKAQIDVQIDYIELLKEQCPPGSGQKRKRECA